MSAIVVLILRILLVALLYGFFGWALITIWRDLRTQGQLMSSPHIPELSLEKAGDDSLCAFTLPEIMIGRSERNEYPIANDTVSSRHARLSFHHNQWRIEDMNSTNGTFLNDERVSVPTVIVSGDELRCGNVNMLIHIEEKSR